MSVLDPFLSRIETSWPYGVLLAFYPVLSSIIWTTTGATYYWRRERRRKAKARPEDASYPYVSVLVRCHCEEALIAEMLRSRLALDYPDFEVVVVDDGSIDGGASPAGSPARLSTATRHDPGCHARSWWRGVVATVYCAYTGSLLSANVSAGQPVAGVPDFRVAGLQP